MKQKKDNNKLWLSTAGFTLIELLVVISIIGLLASVVLISFVNVRLKARDVKRLADLRQFTTALELYYSQNNRYPISKCTTDGDPRFTGFDSPSYSPNQFCNSQGGALNGKNLTQEMAPFMGAARDPKNLGSDSGYLYIGITGAEYCILFWRTPEDLRNYPTSVVNFARCTGGIDSNGQCMGSFNSIYKSEGGWSTGC